MLNNIKNNISKSIDEFGLSKFLRDIRKFPMLTAEEENRLAVDWTKNKNFKSAHKLVNSHLRLVVKIAMGFRLSTYAMWWIRASIQEYILHSWSMVKIGTTAAQKKLFFNLRSLKGKLKALDDGDLQPELVTEIAERLNVSEPDVVDMNRRMSGHDHSLNSPLSQENEGEWINWIVDDRDSHEASIIYNDELRKRKQILDVALNNLNDRERQILIKRRLMDKPLTLEELSKSYGISRERVRQVEVRAFQKLQKVVKNIGYKNKNFNQ